MNLFIIIKYNKENGLNYRNSRPLSHSAHPKFLLHLAAEHLGHKPGKIMVVKMVIMYTIYYITLPRPLQGDKDTRSIRGLASSLK